VFRYYAIGLKLSDLLCVSCLFSFSSEKMWLMSCPSVSVHPVNSTFQPTATSYKLRDTTELTEPGSSGNIVSDYGLDDRAIGVRSPAGAKDFSSSLCVQSGSEAHPASCTMGTGGPFPGGKSAARA
jgi:hypothetical protein